MEITNRVIVGGLRRKSRRTTVDKKHLGNDAHWMMDSILGGFNE